jgi:short-subunit dehydrogenase
MSGNSKSLTNQVAVITGASRGIGWALAKELAASGCKLGLIARSKDDLEALNAEIRRAGGTAECAVADVSNREQTLLAFAELSSRLGPVDLLIANAGVGIPTLLKPMNVTNVERVLRVNLLGVIYSIEAALPDMLQQRRGRLAVISSLAAYKGLPGQSAYCASKAAINAYMEGLRIQLHGTGVAVTTVCPGYVRTAMTAPNTVHMPWLMEADDAARRIVWALARGKKVYNFPWQTAWLVKLARFCPDWALARVFRINGA